MSSEELTEVNAHFAAPYYAFTLKRAARGQPNELFAYNLPIIGGCTGLGFMLGANAHFFKGYSLIWLVAGVIPLGTSLMFNSARQP